MTGHLSDRLNRLHRSLTESMKPASLDNPGHRHRPLKPTRLPSQQGCQIPMSYLATMTLLASLYLASRCKRWQRGRSMEIQDSCYNFSDETSSFEFQFLKIESHLLRFNQTCRNERTPHAHDQDDDEVTVGAGYDMARASGTRRWLLRARREPREPDMPWLKINDPTRVGSLIVRGCNVTRTYARLYTRLQW
jgi:hypothetical protein